MPILSSFLVNSASHSIIQNSDHYLDFMYPFTFGFLGNATYSDVLKFTDMLLQSYILFISSVVLSTTKSYEIVSVCIMIQFRPGFLLLFILSSTDLTSTFNISSDSIFLCNLSSWNNSLKNSPLLWSTFSSLLSVYSPLIL